MAEYFFGAISRTARRRLKHACLACGLAVLKGDRYERCAAVSDGSLYSYNLHAECGEELQRHYTNGDVWPQGVLDGRYLDHEDACSPEWVAWFEVRKQQEALK